MNNLFFKNSLFFKAESILKEFIENFEKIEHNWDKFTELKVKVAMFSIFKKNWDIYEKIFNIVTNNLLIKIDPLY